jgi:hypothetical protein
MSVSWKKLTVLFLFYSTVEVKEVRKKLFYNVSSETICQARLHDWSQLDVTQVDMPTSNK